MFISSFAIGNAIKIKKLFISLSNFIQGKIYLVFTLKNLLGNVSLSGNSFYSFPYLMLSASRNSFHGKVAVDLVYIHIKYIGNTQESSQPFSSVSAYLTSELLPEVPHSLRSHRNPEEKNLLLE